MSSLQFLRDGLRGQSKNAQALDADLDRAIDQGRQRIGLMRHPLLLEMEVISSPVTGMAVPLRFMSARSLDIDGKELQQVMPTVFTRLQSEGRSTHLGRPYFAVIGSKLGLSVNSGLEATLLFYQMSPPLVAPGDTNPFLQAFSSLWLQACLIYWYQFLQEDDPRAAAEVTFSQAAELVVNEGARAEWGGAMSRG